MTVYSFKKSSLFRCKRSFGSDISLSSRFCRPLLVLNPAEVEGRDLGVGHLNILFIRKFHIRVSRLRVFFLHFGRLAHRCSWSSLDLVLSLLLLFALSSLWLFIDFGHWCFSSSLLHLGQECLLLIHFIQTYLGFSYGFVDSLIILNMNIGLLALKLFTLALLLLRFWIWHLMLRLRGLLNFIQKFLYILVWVLDRVM